MVLNYAIALIISGELNATLQNSIKEAEEEINRLQNELETTQTEKERFQEECAKIIQVCKDNIHTCWKYISVFQTKLFYFSTFP